jgi:dTMP kinase
LLLSAARRDHVIRRIAPALASGRWVVCDRFADSTLAYQGYGRALPIGQLQQLQGFVLGALRPDLTLILDLPVAQGLARAARRSAADRFEALDTEFHERLRRGYRTIAAAEPERCVLIEAAGDTETVERAILAAIEARLGVRLGAG